MRVDIAEIEFSGEQEDDGAHSGEAAIAACLALGRLEQAVDGFEEAVGLPCLGPVLTVSYFRGNLAAAI